MLVAVHGGGWQGGTRKNYTTRGLYLARNGNAAFSIEYRLSKPGAKSYPGAVYDTKAAVQYVRVIAATLGIDPDRIGMIGDSAGGHLSALVALAGEEPQFSGEYRSDPHASVSSKVKAVVGVYGVYDMLAQWQHDLLSRPRDNIGEKFPRAPRPTPTARSSSRPRRSAMPRSTRTRRASCWSTAPTTTSSIRRPSRPPSSRR